MPFTPIHMGPGLLLKACGGRHVSLMVFGYTQVLIDIESGANMLRGAWPVHAELHSYAGATLIGAFALVTGPAVCGWLLRLWNSRLGPQQGRLSIQPQIPWLAATTGALLGAWSHVLLDSIMHADMLPLRPFSDANPLLFTISVGRLHQLCFGAAAVGLLILGVWALLRRRPT